MNFNKIESVFYRKSATIDEEKKPQIKAPRVTPLEGVSTHGAAMRVRGVENPQGFGIDKRRFLKNEDAVSISVGFILTFSITVIVFSAVVISFYTLTTQSEKIAMQDSFEILGSGLAMRINTVDALVNITGYYGGEVNALEYEISIPATIANEGYSINITNATKKLILEADNGAIAWVPFNTSVNLEEKKIPSNVEDYKLTYNKNEKLIKIEKQ